MRGFLEWFGNQTKIKRWLFCILVGIVLTCYAIFRLLMSQEVSFVDIAKITICFAAGFTAVVIGIVFIQKRTLELAVKARDDKDSLDMKALMFHKDIYENGPKVVAIGGGTGLNSVLEGIKNYTKNITAIVTVSDYGQGPTDSRKELELLPLEDIKESMVALAEESDQMQKLMQHSFVNERLRKLSFGDIYMLAMREIYGNYSESVQKASSNLKLIGKVLPVTLDEMKICAELMDGTIVEEKDRIPEAVTEKISKINRIYITPSNCIPAPGVLEAIKEADCIILGPGSLYTNVIPNLLIKHVAKEIKESKAIKVYVNNIMTEPGQTDNYSLSEHIQAIFDHVGTGVMDFCICDTGEPTPEFIRRYNEMGSDLVEQDIERAVEKEVKIIRRNLSAIKDEFIRHDPEVIASTIMELVADDLKFKDKQVDDQYLLVHSKLGEQKKKQKAKRRIAKRETPKEKKPRRMKKQSKFQVKYQNRLESIQTSDEKRKENLRKLKEAEKLNKTNK